MAVKSPVQRRLFTVAEYHEMVQVGILGEDDRVELIEGEIIRRSPIGSRHAACVDRFNQKLSSQVGRKVIVRVQNPVHLGDHSEPQPDLCLVRAKSDFYARQHPGTQDILLVIEVAEDAAGDRALKIPLYARAGIREVWLVDLEAEIVEVYLSPAHEGYRKVRKEKRGKSLVPTALPDVEVALGEIFG